MIILTIIHAILPPLGDDQAIVVLTPSCVLHDGTILAVMRTVDKMRLDFPCKPTVERVIWLGCPSGRMGTWEEM
eukprot:3394451-Prorocentrum_lima.AAC.1